MKAEDLFAGPLLRRAEPGLVVVCLATFGAPDLRFSVREAGATQWLAHDDAPVKIRATRNLTFHFSRIAPTQPLRVGTLLEYGIAELVNGGFDYAAFKEIVRAEKLAYGSKEFPSFMLQAKSDPLRLLYGSCRKIHDTKGGKMDGLVAGDALLETTFADASKRPTLLCLGGDQIYADDVHDLVRQEIDTLARKIEGDPQEAMPDAPGLSGNRKSLLKKVGKFTSDDLKNHVMRFSEYLALYGLMLNGRNWSRQHRDLAHFTDGLPKVRRLLANLPTYMIFDDHDITDDWNLDVDWELTVWRSRLGRRVVANGLMAYWLFQGYGNDPNIFDGYAGELKKRIEGRIAGNPDVDDAFWNIADWEFSTPTYPPVYFLDTRTQRGARDDPAAHQRKAPAFLKSHASWKATADRIRKLVGPQSGAAPLVLVSAAPVFGFRWVEALQSFVSSIFGVYKYDLENWAANDAHFRHFLQLLAGRNVLVLSGDVHYGFSSTVRYVEFDSQRSRGQGPRTNATGMLPIVPSGANPTYRPTSTARFLQICSSAINNFAGGFWTRFPAWLSRTQLAKIERDGADAVRGSDVAGGFVVLEPDPDDVTRTQLVARSPQDVRPTTLFKQRINDSFNSRYVENHNLGMVTIRGSAVEHCFLMEKGRHSEHRWDFSNASYWE